MKFQDSLVTVRVTGRLVTAGPGAGVEDGVGVSGLGPALDVSLVVELSLVVLLERVEVEESVSVGVSVAVQSDWQLNMDSGERSPTVLSTIPVRQVVAQVEVSPLA
jgi:hypothetical protein